VSAKIMKSGIPVPKSLYSPLTPPGRIMPGLLAVFDLDGTLHRTDRALLPAIRAALEEIGVTGIDDERINSLYGEPLEVFASTLLEGTAADAVAFREGIRRHQRRTLPEYGELYPGVGEMLSEAATAGWTLAVLSNAGMDYIELVTSTLGIRRHFEHLRGRDGGDGRKTARLMDLMAATGCTMAVMVGDRYHDIEAAREAGITSIGCGYGYGAPREIERADHLVRSVGEIGPLLDRLGAARGPIGAS
jgi:phosphoglycolate phosphatase